MMSIVEDSKLMIVGNTFFLQDSFGAHILTCRAESICKSSTAQSVGDRICCEGGSTLLSIGNESFASQLKVRK
jgi:hypothetical protein